MSVDALDEQLHNLRDYLTSLTPSANLRHSQKRSAHKSPKARRRAARSPKATKRAERSPVKPTAQQKEFRRRLIKVLKTLQKRSAAAPAARKAALARVNTKYRKQLAPLVKRVKKEVGQSARSASPTARRRSPKGKKRSPRGRK